MLSCDVLVIGCGPAGASAARASALNGRKVVCVEKKKRIGIPVQCAEGIGSYLLPHLPFGISKNQLKWNIDGISFCVDGVNIIRKGEFWKGYTLNRSFFDPWLSSLAEKAGARIMTGTEFVEFDKKGCVHCNSQGKSLKILAKTIVASDGSESKVLQELGEYHPKKGDVGEVYSWEMDRLKLADPHLEQIFVGEFAPGGYGYIFPKSKKVANVGVGIPYPVKDPLDYFEQFLDIDSVKTQVGEGVRIVEKSKKEIWGDVSKKWVYGNVIIAGDAANHNLKPFIEGILPAIISGNLAGELACLTVAGQQVRDREYRTELRKRLGSHFDTSRDAMIAAQRIFKLNRKSKYLLFTGMMAHAFKIKDLEWLEALTYNELKVKLEKLSFSSEKISNP